MNCIKTQLEASALIDLIIITYASKWNLTLQGTKIRELLQRSEVKLITEVVAKNLIK